MTINDARFISDVGSAVLESFESRSPRDDYYNELNFFFNQRSKIAKTLLQRVTSRTKTNNVRIRFT